MSASIDVRPAGFEDAGRTAALAALLWPANDEAALRAEFEALAADPRAAVFLAREGERAAGFAHCQLRTDYVEGTDSSPVGYLEAVYVLPEYRSRGLGRALVAACEAWARRRGCREFASDCELLNAASLRFHLRLGFEEANRIICFRKAL